MIFLSLFFLVSSSIINSPLIEVNIAVQKVLTESGYEIGYSDDCSIITNVAEIDIKDLYKYIIEEFPDENPGWTQARVQIFIRLRKVDNLRTEIDINAGFERFGTPSALLLIPPEWRIAQSNGILEKELFDKINAVLSTEEEK